MSDYQIEPIAVEAIPMRRHTCASRRLLDRFMELKSPAARIPVGDKALATRLRVALETFRDVHQEEFPVKVAIRGADLYLLRKDLMTTLTLEEGGI